MECTGTCHGSIDNCRHCEWLRKLATNHKRDLDLANARVAVLREGLEQEAQRLHANCQAWGSRRLFADCLTPRCQNIAALLASPDDAAAKLLAVRDATLAREAALREALAALERLCQTDDNSGGMIINCTQCFARRPDPHKEGCLFTLLAETPPVTQQ